MHQTASLAEPDNPYIEIVYDHLGDPIPPTHSERIHAYLSLQNSLQTRLASSRAAAAETRINLELMADAIAVVEERIAAGVRSRPAPAPASTPAPATAPTPANEDRPAPRRRAALSFGGYLAAIVTAALVTVATFFTVDRLRPLFGDPTPPSLTLIDELQREVAQPAKYQAYFDLMAKLETKIDKFKQDRGVYPTTRDKAFLAVSSVQLFGDAAPDRGNTNLWRFWESLSYASDGADYKLISIGLGTCAVVRILRPELLDPKRSQHPFDCLAFGIWTAGGRDF